MRIFLLLLLSLVSERLLAAPTEAPSPKKELRCLALNIYFEARSEPTDGQFAVAFVTMNRVQSRRFPNSVCGVVWQHRQFSWTHDGKSDKPYERRAWRRAQQIAHFVYRVYTHLPQSVQRTLDRTNGALHYYAPRLANPYWAQAKEITLQVGGHVFLGERS